MGQCAAEGVFGRTNVGEVATYECSSQGNYVGTQQRACVLGAEDGVWEKASGYCISVATIVILVLVAIAAIVVVVFILMRTNKKAKAVGGAKGKKSSSTVKKAAKKTVSKKVKV